MIFVDTSTFLRYLVQPATPQDRVNERRAAALFSQVNEDIAEITTSEAVLAEVVFILTSPRHYQGPRSTSAAGVKALLRPKGCRMPAKDVCLRALDLWVEHPKLSFPDALGAAYSELRGHDLATFDEAQSRVASVRAYTFADGESS